MAEVGDPLDSVCLKFIIDRKRANLSVLFEEEEGAMWNGALASLRVHFTCFSHLHDSTFGYCAAANFMF